MSLVTTEDLDAFFHDFGVDVDWGGASIRGILDMPDLPIPGAMTLSTEYAIQCKAEDFDNGVGVELGDAIEVDGVDYTIRDFRLIDDGKLCRISLSKVDE